MQGTISTLFETGVRHPSPYTISTGKGDHGGASYGSFQLSSNKGVVQRFVDQYFRDKFTGFAPASPEFNASWRMLPERELEKAEAKFMRDEYFLPMIHTIGVKERGLSAVAGEIIISTAVQYGIALGKTHLRTAPTEYFTQGFEERLAARVQWSKYCNVDTNFRSSSPAVREGVRNRIWQEWCELIDMVESPVYPGAPYRSIVRTDTNRVVGTLGKFVSDKEGVIRAFQERVGITADGIAGQNTWRAYSLLAIQAVVDS